ncbi:MAG: polysaccharide export protein [Alphaproteobacteria bacterium]|nr:polysaccharide export protein [Alphaproteobacteria bacterium]
MFGGIIRTRVLKAILAIFLAGSVAACAADGGMGREDLSQPGPLPDYLIGPGDVLQIFVWRNPELSTTIPVRPDGRISVPLIEDLEATRKTPTMLARDIENILKQYIQDPVVTVIVQSFVGPYQQQVRVIGEAARPQALPYRENMTVLDVMIAVGGLTQFAAGNRAVINRKTREGETNVRVNLDRLIKDGDVGANVRMLPGDILIVPQSWF